MGADVVQGPEREKEARIPFEEKYRDKSEMALELLDQAISWGVPPRPVINSLIATEFTGYIKLNFSQGAIGRIEKYEEILKK